MTLDITPREVGSANMRHGRRGDYGIDQIVIHVTEGEAEGTRSWFAQSRPDNPTSAHYQVLKDGMVDRFVADEDEAFHAGRVLNPTAPLVLARPGVNPNWYSIGIEHEGSGATDMTQAQHDSSVELVDSLCLKYNIPVDRGHIVGHHEIFSGKTCPGAINVDKLVASIVARRATGAAAAHPAFEPRPNPPLIVWSNYFKDWLIVTRVLSDTEWYFVPVKQLTSPQKAQTALSSMPRQ